MKKLWILLVAVAMLGAAPLFADVTLSGEFMGFGSTDFDTMSGAFPKVELNLNAVIDDFNTLSLELDSEGSSWSGWDSAVPGTFVDDDGEDVTVAARSVAVDDIRLVTDWGAALGLPVGVKTTIGYFDTYFTGWYYYDASGWTWYYDWPNKLVNQGPDANGAVQLDVAAGPVNVHLYTDGAGEDFMAGLSGGFAGASFWLAYGTTYQAFGEGNLAVEAAYAIMDIANVGGFFRFGLADSSWTYGVNLGADFGMVHAAAGLEGDSVDALDNIVVELALAPVDPAKIAVVAFMDLGGADAFSGLDVSASYMVGAAKFALGYAYAPAGGATIVYPSGDNYAANGFYLGVDVDF